MEKQWQAIPLEHSPEIVGIRKNPCNVSFRPRTPFFLIEHPCPIFNLDDDLPACAVKCGKKFKNFLKKNARKRAEPAGNSSLNWFWLTECNFFVTVSSLIAAHDSR
jgi:hypothetical protein